MSATVDEEPAALLAEKPAASLQPASASARVAAGLLDAGLLLVALGFVLGTELAFASETEQDLFLYGWFVVFAPLFFALYHAFGTGATPGQLELRIGLRDTVTGERPGLSRAVARAYLGFAFLVLVVPALIDLLVLAGGRSLRDRITRTTAVGIALEGKAPELAGPTVPELVAIFEPPAGTRSYLGRGWALLQARPRLVLGPVAALCAVLVAIAVVLALLFTDSVDEDTFATFGLFASLLLVSGAYWTQAVVVTAVEELRVGDPRASVRGTLVRASRRANALTAALLVLLLLPWVVLLTLFLALPVLGRLTMVAPALVLEDTRVLGAFRRSWQLTRGQTWRLLGLLLLSYFSFGAVVWGANLVMAPLSVAVGDAAAGVVGVVLSGIALVVALAWLGAAWSLVYEDARRALPPGAAR